MRIFVKPNRTFYNLGDRAMFEAAYSRLKARFPGATFYVFTTRPEQLAAFCPDAIPVSEHSLNAWFDDWLLLGRRLHRFLPGRVAARWLGLERGLRRWPRPAIALLRLKMRLARQESAALDAFEAGVLRADAILISGQGGMMDEWAWEDLRTLGLLETGQRMGKVTALLGQGMGPVQSPALLKKMAAVLPRADLIGLREKRATRRLLDWLKVPPERVIVTGDDTVERVYRECPAVLGNGLGVNLRVASYAGVGDDLAESLRGVLHTFSADHAAPLLPVPISFWPQEMDLHAVEEWIATRGAPPISDQDFDTPLKVIRQIGRCRLVLTGSYHAGVFALAQGIPVVALARSPYYIDKFLGLADMFGTGCEVVLLEGDHLPERLALALDSGWQSADRVRPQLLEAAARQVEQGQAAYQRLFELIAAREHA